MSGINHKRVVASRDTGMAVDWNEDHEQKGNHDCQKYQFLNQVIENRTDYPAGPVEGQVIYRTDLHAFYVWNGTEWMTIQTLNNFLLTPSSAPTSNYQVANKKYVDDKITGVVKTGTIINNNEYYFIIATSTFIDVVNYGNINLPEDKSIIFSIKATVSANTQQGPSYTLLRWKVTVNGETFYSPDYEFNAQNPNWSTNTVTGALNAVLFEPGSANVTLQARTLSGVQRNIRVKDANIILVYLG